MIDGGNAPSWSGALAQRGMCLDFRTLRNFLCVADARSFSKAAELLFVAQPALSRQVRKLEDELGVQLFVRAPSGVQLTDAGVVLYRHALVLLRGLSHAADDVRAHGSSVSGAVTLGISPTTGELLIPALLKRCARAFPDIHVNVVEGFSGHLYERLLNEEVTLALLYSPVRHRSILVEPILDEPMCIMGPGRSINGLHPVHERMRLQDLPLILPGPTHQLRGLLDRALPDNGAQLDVRFEVDGLVTTRAMVAAGLGYTILAHGAAQHQIEQRLLSAVPLVDPVVPWTLCCTYLSEQHLSRPLAAVRGMIRKVVLELVEAGRWRGTSPARHASDERSGDSAPDGHRGVER